jgi:RHS repeat-associated protein
LNPFTWDARNRLVAIGTSASIASFVYDGLNRRQTATLNGTSTSYLYSGDDVVQELQGGTAAASELNGLSTDERFSRNGSAYLTDLLGSTVALASGGAVQTSYGYDPYGVAQAPVGAASTNPFQFTGRENDATSAGLMFYRARYYNPGWGRFVSEDPIGVNGGVNLYGYVEQRPTNATDPSGAIIVPNDPSGLPPEWVRDPRHNPRSPTDGRWRNPSGGCLEFNKGKPGEPGSQGVDHWHDCTSKKARKDPKGHYLPGQNCPQPGDPDPVQPDNSPPITPFVPATPFNPGWSPGVNPEFVPEYVPAW